MKNIAYECKEGWIALIEDAKTLVAKYNLSHPNDEYKLEFIQIKEKWGGLRLYLNYYVPEIADKIHELEEKSYNICENCGTMENVDTKWTHGHVMTLCNKCREQELKNWEEQIKKMKENV